MGEPGLTSRAEPRFDLDLEYGKQGELLIEEYLEWIARRNGRVEVKTKTYEDAVFFVETYCDKGRTGTYEPSGINVTTAEAWAFVAGSTRVALIVPTEAIKATFRAGLGIRKENNRGSCPTKGRLFTMSDFLRGAAIARMSRQ